MSAHHSLEKLKVAVQLKEPGLERLRMELNQSEAEGQRLKFWKHKRDLLICKVCA